MPVTDVIAEAAEVLRRAGFTVDGRPSGPSRRRRRRELRPDLRAERRETPFVVEVKQVRDLSTGALAESLLRVRALALTTGAQPLLVLATPSLPSEAATRGFAERLAAYRLDVSWIAFDPSHAAIGRVLGEPLQLQGDGPLAAPTLRGPGSAGIPITDASQWLLKLLLMGPAPETWWLPQAPARGQPVNANQLAALAGVSIPTAYRLMRSLEAAGYVASGWGAQPLTAPEALLEEWTGRYRLTDNSLWPFGPDPYALPAAWRDEVLRRLRARGDAAGYALTAYAACEVTERQRTRQTTTLHVYVDGDVGQTARALDLVPEPHPRGRDLVYLIQPAYPTSVFRGASLAQGLRVVDPLQCYLDLFHNHDAGREQALYLYEQVIQPRIEARLGR